MLNFKNPVIHHLREPRIITKLHLLRENKGFSMGYLAFKCGVPKRTLMMYEYGKLEMVKMPVGRFIKLCKALDCKAEDLLGDRNNQVAKIFEKMI